MSRPSARERLLDCAEWLFAEHGIEGISLRSINAEAGLSSAALHYHFGSKQTVVESLLERRMPALMERRRQRLDALDEGPGPATTREILSALLLPQVELLAEGGEPGIRYIRLIHRLQSDGDLDFQFVIERWPGGVDRLVPLLQRANPSLPRPLIERRLAFAIDVMLPSLVKAPKPVGDDLETYVSALLDFLTGAFEAPITGDSNA
ncbi:MAG: TetR/AcrR family transcriptional regulator [Deltaproteobacteria bacterium]|nr:TetR/AcrR family transcriptional regulator [Deltaproteobacteria bacterium]